VWQTQLHRESTNFPPKTSFTGFLPAAQEAELRDALTFLDADSREQWVEAGAITPRTRIASAVRAPRRPGRLRRAAAGEKPQARTAPSGEVYESTLKAIRWRAAWSQ
jgi:hypothetical protein